MGFANFYFNTFHVGDPLISKSPVNDLEQIVIIPAFKENNTIEAMKSLYFCLPTQGATEVIVLVNYPENCEKEYGHAHQKLNNELQTWSNEYSNDKLQFFICLIPLKGKHAGVGMARKIAMDEAVRRFDYLNKPNGVIISYDADCTCEANYLQSIEKAFKHKPEMPGCSIYFEHPLEGSDYEQFIYDAIIQYELYLRYYIESLRFAGFPYAFHTLGSSFAVRATDYVKQGGMNQRKAGEDFYFLHKIIPIGQFGELNDTCVFPSPRESDRVPFGTGAAISKIIDCDTINYDTFNPDAFFCLKQFFELVPSFYKANETVLFSLLGQLKPVLCDFLISKQILVKITEFNSNCASFDPFQKRFYNWFNGLMVLQFLNESHENAFRKIPVLVAIKVLFSQNQTFLSCSEPKTLLVELRKMQRNR